MTGAMVCIHTFDDGNDRYRKQDNIWEVIGTHHNGQKLILRNTQEPSIVIGGLSAWKVGMYEPDAVCVEFFIFSFFRFLFISSNVSNMDRKITDSKYGDYSNILSVIYEAKEALKDASQEQKTARNV